MNKIDTSPEAIRELIHEMDCCRTFQDVRNVIIKMKHILLIVAEENERLEATAKAMHRIEGFAEESCIIERRPEYEYGADTEPYSVCRFVPSRGRHMAFVGATPRAAVAASIAADESWATYGFP